MPAAPKKKLIVIIVTLVVIAGIVGALRFWATRGGEAQELHGFGGQSEILSKGVARLQALFGRDPALRLYGAIDMRTATLAFEEGARIKALYKYEGQTVAVGDVLGELDDSHQRIAVAQAEAKVGVSDRELKLLLAGSRIEEINEARSRVAAAKAAYVSASSECKRQKKLGRVTSAQAVELACSEANVAEANYTETQTALSRILSGARVEQVEVAKANLELAKTNLAAARLSMENCKLKSPVAGTIRTRLKEPGDMVSAGTGVYEIALTDPLWARVWVDESNLGKVKVGGACEVLCDAYRGEKFAATIGFISTVAEFTPKTVQTEEVRTSLVYEVRLTLKDPEHKLRLGMPVTVRVLP